jgi:hypothetical protein
LRLQKEAGKKLVQVFPIIPLKNLIGLTLGL